MTALDFINDNVNSGVVIRYASQGAPAGRDIAWIPPETELSFDLGDVVGEVDVDGTFTATNLNPNCGDAHGWQFRDCNHNYIYAMWLRVDQKVWQEQYDEFMGQ